MWVRDRPRGPGLRDRLTIVIQLHGCYWPDPRARAGFCFPGRGYRYIVGTESTLGMGMNMRDIDRRAFVGMSLTGASAFCLPPSLALAAQCVTGPLPGFLPLLLWHQAQVQLAPNLQPGILQHLPQQPKIPKVASG